MEGTVGSKEPGEQRVGKGVVEGKKRLHSELEGRFISASLPGDLADGLMPSFGFS